MFCTIRAGGREFASLTVAAGLTAMLVVMIESKIEDCSLLSIVDPLGYL